MPQMAPINWLGLFLLFSVSLIIFNMINYYSFMTKSPKSNLMINLEFNKPLNWKW
uniref:ATP synthase F0 subunit 8 n=1 Tax=Halidaya aurea TaxID=1918247 RepID=UPI002000D84E|nr:ATP synthase F0 subunit 8 [Halidaya aurea]UOW81226.1 ATP synthase F0 subunit 8 [Halidaya aurea]